MSSGPMKCCKMKTTGTNVTYQVILASFNCPKFNIISYRI